MTPTLTRKLILVLLLIASLCAALISYLTLNRFKEMVDETQAEILAEKVASVKGVLERYNERLEATGMREAYAADFERSALEALRAGFYTEESPETLLIVDKEGKTVLHPELPRGWYEESKTDIISQALNTRSGQLELTDRNGVDCWYLYDYFEPWEWTVAFYKPIETKYASLNEFRTEFLAIFIICGALALAVLGTFQARMVRPLASLTRLSESMSEGDLDQSVAIERSDEIGLLAKRFEQMRLALREKIAALSAEVETRKEAEEAARESGQKFRSLVETTNAVHWEIEYDTGRYSYVSPQIETLLGYPCESWTDFDVWVERTAADDRETSAEKLKDLLEGRERRLIYRAVDSEGEQHWLQDVYSLLGAESGMRRVVGFTLDITPQKRAEEDKSKLEQQLRQSQKMEAVGSLAGGIAHDFNNILQAVSGYVELMRDMPYEAESFTLYLQQLNGAVQRAAELVRRLLTFSRLQKPEFRQICINDLVKQTLTLLGRTISPMISLEARLEEELSPIMGDATQLEQVLINLCTNARDAMPEGGEIMIETKNVSLDEAYCEKHIECSPGDYIQLSVSDTGSGIDKETQQHIFEPFYTTKEVGKGTGLGLSTVYGAVKGHKGNITCYSDEQQGTTFKVLLPIALQAAANEVKPLGKENGGLSMGGVETVLVVDDEEAIRGLAAKALEYLGYTVLQASSGEEGLEKFGEAGAGIDLVLLDLGMPGMGGANCLTHLLKRNPNVKVIIASGYGEMAQHDKALEAGAKGFLPKPFILRDMTGIVREVLDA